MTFFRSNPPRTHKFEFRLWHGTDAAEVARLLLEPLDCDNWFVACQRERLLVLRLSKAGLHRYAVRFECTAPMEKTALHESKVCSLSVQPAQAADDLSDDQIGRIRATLAQPE